MINLFLNGIKVSGYGLKVTCELALPEEDLSGQSSSTAVAEKGFKPKRLRVAMKVRYEDVAELRNLVALSTATVEKKETRLVYNIQNQTAEAFSVRQVRFSDKVSAQELDDIQAWSVSFVLLEHLSVAEKIESMNLSQNEPKVAVADASVASEAESGATSNWLDNVLKYLDSALADEGASNEI